MKKLFAITLGILTAIGGFVDIGDLVANAAAGARFRFGLAWVVFVGVGGIVVYAEMAGRVASISGRPVFSLVRERLGPRFGLANLFASLFINFLTLTAEIAGVAIALSMVASVNYILLVPFAAALIWILMWRLPFERLEQIFGLAGLALLAFLYALIQFGPDWGEIVSQVTHPAITPDESVFTYAYFAIGLFGAAMTPYEVFFFSSGGGAGCVALAKRPDGCRCHRPTPNTISARPMMPNTFSIIENRILHSTSHTRNATSGIHMR